MRLVNFNCVINDAGLQLKREIAFQRFIRSVLVELSKQVI